MSVWDDSWGYVRTGHGTVTQGKMGAETDAGPNATLTSRRGLLTTTRTTEEVAGMTPAYLGTICQQVDHSVIPPGGAT